MVNDTCPKCGAEMFRDEEVAAWVCPNDDCGIAVFDVPGRLEDEEPPSMYVKYDPAKKVKLNIRTTEGLRELIDTGAWLEGVSRTAFILSAATARAKEVLIAHQPRSAEE